VAQELDLAGLPTKYARVKKVAAFFLERAHKTSEGSTLSTSDLFDLALKEYPKEFADVTRPVFAAYLSKAATEENTSITTLGRRRGYYLTQNLPSGSAESADEEPEELRKKEGRLYRVVQDWLMEQGYRTANVSNTRGGGVWGNPDVCGIELIEHSVWNSIEIVTVEVKLSIEKWERQFFEAVSHKRFANRSYYAFAHPSELVGKLPRDLRYYSELFGVGVLVIAMEQTAFAALASETEGPDVDSDSVDSIELYSAPYQAVPPKYQRVYLDVLGLDNLSDISTFGERLEL
jgi:hypothetical protein